MARERTEVARGVVRWKHPNPGDAVWHIGTYEALRAAGLVPAHVPRPAEHPGKGNYLRWKTNDGARWSLTIANLSGELNATRYPTKEDRADGETWRRHWLATHVPREEDLPPYMTPQLAIGIRRRRAEKAARGDAKFQEFLARAVGTAAQR